MLLSRCILLLLLFNSLYVPVNAEKVVLEGTGEDGSIKHVKLAVYSPFWKDWDFRLLAASARDGDNRFRLAFELTEPTVVSMMVMNRTWSVLITPGDSIHFRISRREGKPVVFFSGERAANYNYNQLWEDDPGNVFRDPPKHASYRDMSLYKAAVDSWYVAKDSFLQAYQRRLKTSPVFAAYATGQLQAEYTYLLYGPLRGNKVKREALPAGYFSRADGFDPGENELKDFTRYKLAALRFKYVYFYKDDMWNELDVIYNNINKNLKGATRDYLLADLLGIYCKKQSDAYHNVLVAKLNAAQKQIKDTACLKYISRSEQEYFFLGKQFPAKVLEETMVESYDGGPAATLAELLSRYKGKAVYIDFWASWCSACREDIRNSAEARAFLVSKGAAYIYLSLDTEKNREVWKKAALVDSTIHHQFIVSKDFSAALVEYLKIKTIPRYLLLDKDHKLMNLDAPRPTIHQLTELKQRFAEISTQVTTFQ